MTKQAVRRGVWYIGGRRKDVDKRGFFPVSALAAPILDTLGGAVIKKLFAGRRRRCKR